MRGNPAIILSNNNNNMFRMLATVFIFLVILTLYLHIAYHLKTSNEMNVYETVFHTKEQLDNICKLRQPIIFNYNEFPSFERERLIEKYGSQKILMKSVDTGEYIPFQLTEAVQLVDKDTTGSYYIEKNSDFIESNLKMLIEKYEKDIRPLFTGKCIYDILIGSNGSSSPLKYEINYRNYFLVTEGSISIRFAPPKSEDYLNAQVDYETLDITSPIQVWKETAVENVEFIDIVASKGQMIHIPPYWWYSIQFTNKASVLSFKYRTYINTLTLLPQIFMQILQLKNIKQIIGTSLSSSPIIEPTKKVKKNKNKLNKLKKREKPLEVKTE